MADTTIEVDSDAESAVPSAVQFETMSGSSEAGPSHKPLLGKRGPCKRHPLWEHFSNTEESSQLWPLCNYCENYKVKGNYKSTLMTHLRSKHPDVAKEVDAKKLDQIEGKERKAQKLLKQQSSLDSFVTKTAPRPHDRDSEKYKRLKRALTLLAGRTSFDLATTESQEF